MNDSFITALNTQQTTVEWMNAISKNMTNLYTPGYREAQFNFKTFLEGASIGDLKINTGQGKAFPGTSPENVYLEGDGFFVTQSDEGELVYTRHGEFTFDNEGIYRSQDGKPVQGYMLNENGEILAGTKAKNGNLMSPDSIEGGPASIPTTNIKLWMDPNNGKYLGKYDEFEIKEDGILYVKSDNGKVKVPLYKLALHNFNNPEGLQEVKPGQYKETEESGKAVVGRGEVRSGLIEMSNTDFKANIAFFQQAKMQMEMTNKLVSTNKQLLEEAMRLLGS